MVNYSKPDIGVFRRDTRIHWDTANELRMLYLQNRSGQTVTTGDIVVWDTANPNSFKLTTTEGDVNVCGVIAQALDEKGNAATQIIANLEWGWVQTTQRCPKVKLTTTASVGNFIQTSTTAGLGIPSADARPGSFAIALTSGTEVECLLGFISPSAIGLDIDAGLLYTDLINKRVGIRTNKPSATLDIQKDTLGGLSELLHLANLAAANSANAVSLNFRLKNDLGTEYDFFRITVTSVNPNSPFENAEVGFDVMTAGGTNTRVMTLKDGNVLINRKVGIGEMQPAQNLHVVAESVANTAIDDYAVIVIERLDAHLQIISEDSGDWGSSLVLTNAPTTGTNRHWWIHHTPVTHGSYPKNLHFRYVETNVTNAIGGDASGTTVLALTHDGKVGVLTTPGNILTIVQYSATDPIADAWTTYSTLVTKELVASNRNYLNNFLDYPVRCWKRKLIKPFRQHFETEAEFQRARKEFQVKQNLSKFRNVYTGLIAEEAPESLRTFDSDGALVGLDLGAYIGWLHAVLFELVELLKKKAVI